MSNTLKFHKQSKKSNINILTESDLNILKNLKRDNSIIICKPDKGRGIVIIDKDDYITKMDAILTDPQTFSLETQLDPFKNGLLLEDKLNRFLKKMLNQNNINEEEYKMLYSTGSNPGIMYGLPKLYTNNPPENK